MKTLLLKHRILSLFVLFVLAISLYGCSDDNGITTFLESQANTTWKFTDTTTGSILYAKINNDETNPFEFWLSIADVGCFIHDSVADDGTVEILENTKNKLVIKVVESAQAYSTITLTVVGDILTAISEEFEDDISIDKNIFILNKTLDDLNGLEICAVPA
jgi:hypothetical protein